MLKKLIKYDLKYGVKIFLLLHAMQLVAAIAGRIFFLERLDFHAPASAVISSLAVFYSMFILIFSIVSMGTMLLIAVRFYKNLFSDEGYLTWTVPASPLQQLWSKLVSGSIWYALSLLLSVLSILILISGKNTMAAYAEITPEINEALGMPLPTFTGVLLGESLLSTLCVVIMIYFCITVGQLFPAHRVLGAIITYFIVYMATTMAIIGCMVVLGVFPGINFQPGNSGAGAFYIISALKISLGIDFLITILEYLIIRWIMTQKINLL